METDAAIFQRMRATADAHLCANPRRRRVDGWEGALVDFLARRMDRPFEWGLSDCCLFAADAVLELTGSDPVASFRGRYNDMRSAAQVLRAVADGSDLEAAVERIAIEHDYDEIALPFVQRGDLLLIDTEQGSALAIQADHRIAAQGPAGVILTTSAHVRRAWAI